MQITAQIYILKLRKNISSNKRYTLRKMSFKFQNLKFKISSRNITLNIYIKIYYDYLYITIIYKCIFTTGKFYWTAASVVKSISKNTAGSIKCSYFSCLIILPTLKNCKYIKKICAYSANDQVLQSFEVYFLRQNKFPYVY